jgi:DNA-binding response OmpR family regulator
MKTKILVVDDDKHTRNLVKVFLGKEGFEFLEAGDGEAALKVLDATPIRMAIVDLMMPKMDGFELCEKIREFYDIPILMLTAKSDTADKVRGFELGTDDYLTKPFDPQELVMRVRALMRRYEINISGSIEIGKVKLDRKSYAVFMADKIFTLPKKEFGLLFTLAGAPCRTFSRDYLIENIWGYDFDGNERTLDVHIGRLREKFPENKSGFAIRTLRGLGYRLEEAK